MQRTIPAFTGRRRWMLVAALCLLGASACDEPSSGKQTTELRLNEVVAGSLDGSTDWFEIINMGDGSVSLDGWSVTDDDPTHALALGEVANVSLEPGGFVVVQLPLTSAWGLGGADCLRLLDPTSAVVDETCWESGRAEGGRSWGRLPDGDGEWGVLGPTPGAMNAVQSRCGNGVLDDTEVCDVAATEALDCTTLLFASGQQVCDACSEIDPSGCVPHVGDIVVNELSSTDDWLELYNRGASPVSLQGYLLSDRVDLRVREVMVEPVTVEAGGYHVVQLDADSPFRLGSEEVVILRSPTDEVVDLVAWQVDAALVSWCRSSDGGGEWVSCPTATPGSANLP